MKNFLNRAKTVLHNEFVEPWKWFFTKGNVTPLMMVVLLLNVFCILIGNIIAVKTFVFYGLENGLKFSIPAAVVIFTLNIVLSDLSADIHNNLTRFSCHIGFLLNILMVAIFTITIHIPGVVGNVMEGAGGAMDTVLGNTWFLFLASLLSYYFGDLINDTVFRKLKIKEGEGGSKLVKRCILSTVFGQLTDSTLFILLGLQILPGLVLGFTFTGGSSLSDPIGWVNMGIMIGIQWVVKVLIEFIVSPLVVWSRNKIKKIDNI